MERAMEEATKEMRRHDTAEAEKRALLEQFTKSIDSYGSIPGML
jgi:hypothetical protein